MDSQTQSKFVVEQTRSPIGRPAHQRQTLVALGLNKIGRRLVADRQCIDQGAWWLKWPTLSASSKAR